MTAQSTSFSDLTDASVTATDGFRLGASLFGRPDAGGRLVVLAPATAVPRAYYRLFASHLAERGWPVLTFDYRGVGGSRVGPLRGFEASMLDWAEKDLAGVIDHATSALGVAHLVVVGHSFGGAALGLVRNASRVRGLVGVGSGLGDLDLYPAPDRLAFKAFMRGVVPALTSTVGYLPGRVGGGEDLPRGVALQWARWALSRDFFLGGRRAPRRAGFRDVRAPVRLYSFDDDRYAPRAVVDALAAVYENAAVERRHVAAAEHGGEVGHFGFFRPRFATTLWADLLAFLDGTADASAPGEARSSPEQSPEQIELDRFMFDRHHRAAS